MKISFVTSTLTSGGSERVISLIANELAERGHEVSIILLQEPLVFYPINNKVKLFYAIDYSSNLFGKIKWLRGHIKREKPDAVLPFMTGVYCTTIFALLGLNSIVISSERIDPRYSPLIRSLLRAVLLRFTTHLVVQTSDIKCFYSKSVQDKTSIIPNPVSEQVFSITNNIVKEKRIISVGRLYKQKNQKLMIDAFSGIADKYPGYKLVIYGEGPLREELTKYIEGKGLQYRVLLPGRSEQIIDELYKSEVFCLSSDYEGMSNALLEALCVGLPIVTTKVSGVSDLLLDGVNAFVVDVKDVDGLKVALDKMLGSEHLRASFALNNKKMAEKYRIENIVTYWEKLIIKLVEEKSSIKK